MCPRGKEKGILLPPSSCSSFSPLILPLDACSITCWCVRTHPLCLAQLPITHQQPRDLHYDRRVPVLEVVVLLQRKLRQAKLVAEEVRVEGVEAVGCELELAEGVDVAVRVGRGYERRLLLLLGGQSAGRRWWYGTRAGGGALVLLRRPGREGGLV